MTDDEICYYIAIFMAVALTIAIAVLFTDGGVLMKKKGGMLW